METLELEPPPTIDPAQPANHNPAAGLDAIRRSKFNIPGDRVFKATADLPDNQRNTIRAMHAYAVENDLSVAEQAKLLNLSEATVSLVYNGKYNAGYDNVVKVYADFLDLQDKRRDLRRLPFIETAMSKKIWQVCDSAREFQKVAFLFSDSQVGKTTSVKEYARKNPGSTVYIEVPTGGGLQCFLVKLAEVLKIGTTARIVDLRRRIMDSFDARMLLIVDESHRAIPAPGNGVRRTALETIEFVRELFNERECGVVFIATNVFRDAMEEGAVQLILKQTRRRRLCSMQLPADPTRADLNTFAAAYGLGTSESTAREIETVRIANDGLGMWLTLLRMASKLATVQKKKMDWNHVIQADAGLKAMEQVK
jgi:hypothetical protein